MGRVRYKMADVNLFNREDWDTMTAFFVKYVPMLEEAFKKSIQEVNRGLRK